MRKTLFVYLAVTLSFGAGIFFVLELGSRLEGPRAALTPSRGAGNVASKEARTTGPAESRNGPAILRGKLPRTLGLLPLQLVVIVIATRLFGSLFRRMGQPSVIGEIVAGITLGPSVFGLLAPALFGYLFDASSLPALELLSEVGVVLFLFLVGLELDTLRLRQGAQTALIVSHAGIVVPYFLGVATSLLLYRDLAPVGVSFLAFALFMGIAMSITAFPVLARILAERRLTATPLGETSLTCAAIDDVTAWSILAFVVAVVGSRGLFDAVATIVWTLLFVAGMFLGVRPLLDRLFAFWNRGKSSGGIEIAATLAFLLASALTTAAIGIHPLFGSFLAGVVMPRQARVRQAAARHRLEQLSLLLLPVFFAFTGLRTQIGLLRDPRSWLVCLLVIFVATAGKLGGCMLAARWTRLPWIDAFSLGALMNTRGLMELIALNIGYELGILSPRIFAMMVLMALTTTFSAGPLLSLADRLRKRAQRKPVAQLDLPRTGGA